MPRSGVRSWTSWQPYRFNEVSGMSVQRRQVPDLRTVPKIQ